MARRVKLTVQFQTPDTDPLHQFRVVVTASSATDMPAEIFLYTKQPTTAYADATDKYLKVCTPTDLAVYPAHEPTPDSSPPYFRLATIDVIDDSREQLLSLWRSIQARTAQLIDSLNISDELVESSEVWIGAAP